MFSSTIIEIVIILMGSILPVQCQNYRLFPQLSNLARQQPITSSPTEVSCGTPTRSTFCRSSISPDSVANCIEDNCDQTCPLRYELPDHDDLLDAANYDVCVTKDTINKATQQTSFSARFTEGTSCYLKPYDNLAFDATDGKMTLTFWMKPESSSAGTIVEKKATADNRTIFSVKTTSDKISIDYMTQSGKQLIEFVDNYIPSFYWTHVGIQVYQRFINLFINGTEVGSSPTVASLLTSRLIDAEGETRIGQSFSGLNQFKGRLQDVRSYKETLSNREIDEIMTGTLPVIYSQSDCRCPPSHPRVKPLLNRYCIKNGMGDTTSDQVLRLGGYAHPLEFANDGDTNSIWISTAINEVFLTVDLGDSFQVFYVVIQFYSPLPKALRIQRQKTLQDSWTDWQYYADDCEAYFGMVNNGLLTTSNSVNCLQLSTSGENPVPYSRGNITFSILSQAPIARPGHNDFYNTPALYSFVKASKVRVSMKDHFFATNPRHQYFGIYEFLVTGRCDCNGHASVCDTTVEPYTCQCDADSFTQGNQCSSCLPMYNDKPFRVGDQVNSYPCKPCYCNNHATSCVYNKTLDLYPADHFRGGGGQCVNCQHNTEGVSCERCISLYYRSLTEDLTSPNVCQACDCDTKGTINGTEQCNQNGGQCPCKENVEGRRCDQCKAGTFNLLAANPSGCSSCGCNPDGVRDNNMTCDQSGQCLCKAYVRGLKCDQCEYGYFNLSSSNRDGCSGCECDPRGARSLFCDPQTGACLCKTNVIGFRCDECKDGFWDIERNCVPCSAHCDATGTEPGSICDKMDGQCTCKVNVQGHACDSCKPDYYSFGSSPALGCISCGCNLAGTVDNSTKCHQTTGQCSCKTNVKGTTCNECAEGCSPCDCDPTGTINGDSLPIEQLPCDQNTGACTCLSHRQGRRCDGCENTYYLSSQVGGGCLPCNCHPKGSVSQVCDLQTGVCQCKLGNAGVGGDKCDQCDSSYYNFNSFTGSCTACDCSPAGSINGTCSPTTGECDCKQFVAGRQCDTCVEGASNLNADNPYGCSKEPSQQPPPLHTPLSSTGLQLYWSPPDYPNGVIISYQLYRNGQLITEIDALADYDEEVDPWLRYNDTGLYPYTNYTYRVRSANEFGFTESPEVIFRTPPGAPSGDLVLNVSSVTAYSAVFRWNALASNTGSIEKYILTYSSDMEPEKNVKLYEGLSLTTSTSALLPFTNYSFTISACTSGGCSASLPVWVLTGQAPPAGQGAPTVAATSTGSFYIEWEPPAQPNGVIISYEVWIRGLAKADGSRDPQKYMICYFQGQYNLRPSAAQDNALPPPDTNCSVTGLTPYTQYEIQVLSQNEINKAASVWVTATTLEAAPVFMPAPIITAVSSTELHLQWIEPAKDQLNGAVVIYRLLQIFQSDLHANPFDPPTYGREIYSNATERQFTLSGLTPYTEYRFKVQVCNSIACVDSVETSQSTLPAEPSQPGHPRITAINSTTLSISWTPPIHLNGPPPYYSVIQSEVALSSPPPRVIKGTRFPGGGYYLFPPETIPQGVAFTGIEIWFKTTQWDGLLLFLASVGNQEEFIAVQLRAGRPWFLFDPQGCSTFVELDPALDNNATYSDNVWHQLVVTRTGLSATISIDDTINGTRTSDCATGTIIGSNTGVYIGGLPKDYITSRTERDPRANVIRQGFQGCIGQVKILQQQYPQEVWATMDWLKAIDKRDSYPTWHGCPVSLEAQSTHFPGRGWLELESPFLTINTNSLQMDLSIRTEYPDGLLFYAYGGKNVYMYAQIVNGHIEYVYRQDDHVTSTILSQSGMNICDGEWHSIAFVKSGQQLTIQVDRLYQAQNGPAQSGTVNLASNFYLGGVAPSTEGSRVAEESNINFTRSFGGCMKDLKLNRRPVDMLGSMVNFTAINLDGCPALQQANEACRVSREAGIYNGTYQNSTTDTGLSAFTDYMYKVVATNAAGSSETPWVIATTKEAPPTGVIAPYYAKPDSGYSIDVEWFHPTGNTGLIHNYTIKAYDLQRVNISVETTFNNSTTLKGVLSTTIPYTNYSLHLVACTMAGCTESEDGIYTQTLPEAPEQVQPPYVKSVGSNYILIGWGEPFYPNGPITGYVLYHEDAELYAGAQNSYNFTGLQVFTSYRIRLRACTAINCTDSPTVSLSTAELPPEIVEAPQIIVYGTRRLDVKWLAPDRLNGVLRRYIIYMSTSVDSLPGDVVYNSSDIGFQYYRNETLTAGTKYFVTLEACTGGGCTKSEAANATTLESSPEDVQDPIIIALSSSALMVYWEPPKLPNGVITAYKLSHNSQPAYEATGNGLLMYNVTGLLPYSLHTFQLEVCTAEGCSLSNEVSGRTLEAKPQGSVTVQVELPVTEPREVKVKWTRIQTPNGVVTYTVYFDGLYYMNASELDFTTIRQRRPLLATQIADEWVTVDDLLAFSSYQIQVNASNSAGFVVSNTLSVTMPPGSPDGVSLPALSAVSSSSIQASWGPPGRVNGPDPPGVLYQLYYRPTLQPMNEKSVFPQNTAATSFTQTGLQPYTSYQFRLETSNEHGSTFSDWAELFTKQDVPGLIDPPILVEAFPTYVSLEWNEPSKPNGVITNYSIYTNNSLSVTIAGNQTAGLVKGLIPFTLYMFNIQACTIAGCIRSLDSQPMKTAQDSPGGLSAPTAQALTSTSVLINWQLPSQANGILLDFTVERWIDDSTSIVLTTLPPSSSRQYIDEGSQIQPYTEYRYRVSASTIAGRTFSSWTSVRTKSARPAGLTQPTVVVISSTSLNVIWLPPQSVNGKLDRYLLKYAETPSVLLPANTTQFTITSLIPYTLYNVSVTACTDGGCTESPQLSVRTEGTRPQGVVPPDPIVLSQTYIALQWQRPVYPNGPNLRYTLTRMKIRQPLMDSPENLGLWLEVYSGPLLYYEDRTLSVYTTYIYRLTVQNDFGFQTSANSSQVTTHGGQPMEAPALTITTLSHTALKAQWVTADERTLQGSVESYDLSIHGPTNQTISLLATESSYEFNDLLLNTNYTFVLTLYVNGGLFVSTDPVIGRTADGAPQGVQPPQLFVVDDTRIRVAWVAPTHPNGQVTAYIVYVDGIIIPEVNTSKPGSYVIQELEPYTIYTFVVEVCTVYSCVKSSSVQGTTAEAQPQGLSPPSIQVISATSSIINWREPSQPNGILLRYTLYRRNITDCSNIDPEESPENKKCQYLECGPLQGVCGSTCYNGIKACCGGVIHSPQAGYECCGTQYIPGRNSATDVCCNGKFHPRKDNYQCCGGRYVEVLQGEICCSNNNEIRIGYGDSCCGNTPYMKAGSQICCNGNLHGRYGKQCCGGEVMTSSSVTCCGDDVTGKAYPINSTMTCCGNKYVPKDRTACCQSSNHKYMAHIYDSIQEYQSSNEQCCESERISSLQACCNGRGYNPALYSCADVGSGQGGCGSGTTCPIGSNGFCDKCNFNSSLTCNVIAIQTEQSPATETESKPHICRTSPVLVYSGLQLAYTDQGLMPWSTYEYSLSVSNKAGTQSTEYLSIKTLQAPPTALAPPITHITEYQVNQIELKWSPPTHPNGDIMQYSLWRKTSGEPVEIYRGLELSYLDVHNIQPFRTYVYTLQACNVVGCVQSAEVSAATRQAPPSDVFPPTAEFINSTAIKLMWQQPGQPNGIIIHYIVYDQADKQEYTVPVTQARELLASGLLPYSDHVFVLSVCTEAACSNSSALSVQTSQALPEGVIPPQPVIISSTEIVVYWSSPTHINGLLSSYSLYMRPQSSSEWTVVYTGLDLQRTVTGLSPGSNIQLIIQVMNGAGRANSSIQSVTMPTQTPQGIGKPTLVQPVSPYSILVEWEEPSSPGGVIDQYQVIVTHEQKEELSASVAAIIRSHTVSGLMPFTQYSIRIRACLQGIANSCAAGPGVSVRTLEAPPLNQSKPILEALGPNIVRISWLPPHQPNGIINQYSVYRREAGTSSAYIVHFGDNGTLSFTNAGPEIESFTVYEYQVLVRNSAGEAVSSWNSVTTLEDMPEGQFAPDVVSRGPFSIGLTWTQPTHPNGIILKYEVQYQQVSADPTFQLPFQTVAINPGVFSTTVGGLLPYTPYRLRITAYNSVGNSTSGWAGITTGDSFPEGVRQLQAEARDTGRSILLTWMPPERPNGEITEYRIYEEGSDVPVYNGVIREFVYLRLQPYTSYRLLLEACTSKGCSQGTWQVVQTAEIAPKDQPAPTIGVVTSTTAVIRWISPLNPNGAISKYEVLRYSQGRLSKRTEAPVIIYSTNQTANQSVYEYTDKELLPYSSYKYFIRASNSIGSVESEFTSIETLQAAPTGLFPPVVMYYGSSFGELAITWSPPRITNGIIQSYQLRRDNGVALSFNPDDPKEYIDRNLSAYTLYCYTITACTSGGCTTSQPQCLTTRQSAPLKVSDPIVHQLSSTAFEVLWTRPQVTNGVLTQYELRMDGTIVYSGLDRNYTVTDLSPYTQYRLQLTACTEGGCTSSATVLARTQADLPKELPAPTLRVFSATAIEITWSEPLKPNGVITLYELYRDGLLIFSDLSYVYTDNNLLPNTLYSYNVKATNNNGSVSSLISTARTYMSSPNGLAPPTLIALSSTSVRAVWSPPNQPNGIISNYTLYDDFTKEPLYSGLELTATVSGLSYFTLYTWRIQACTSVGCALSVPTQIRTLEAAPQGLDKPILTPLATESGTHSGILVTWDKPAKSNGEIIRYVLERHQVIITDPDAISFTTSVVVYNGAETSFIDTDSILKAYTSYEYRVWTENTAGNVSSAWSRVLTYSDVPQGLSPPSVKSTTSTSILIVLVQPDTPNGEITSYEVLVNGSISMTTSIGLEKNIYNLDPYTVYELTMRACTLVGCSYSTPIYASTKSENPSGMSPPAITNIAMTSVMLTWTEPTRPNGVIKRYIVYQRLGCPKAYQPYTDTTTCSPSSSKLIYQTASSQQLTYNVTSLLPYTAYQWKVEAVNEIGMSDTDSWSIAQTTADTEPILISDFDILGYDGTSYVLDWSTAFRLNSELKKYEVYKKSASRAWSLVYSGIDSYYIIPNPYQYQDSFYINALTRTGQVRTKELSLPIDPDSDRTTTELSSTKASIVTAAVQITTDELKWMIPVIVIGVILIAILFFLICKFCIRGKSVPYEREKDPIPKRQLRQSMTNLTPIQSFHDVLNTSNPNIEQPVYSQQMTQLSNQQTLTPTPEVIRYTKNPSINSQPLASPVYSLDPQSINQGAVIWPTNVPMYTSNGSVHSKSRRSVIPEQPELLKDTKLGSASSSSEEDDQWESVLQESGMYEDSDFSEEYVGEFPNLPTSFTDTHL